MTLLALTPKKRRLKRKRKKERGKREAKGKRKGRKGKVLIIFTKF